MRTLLCLLIIAAGCWMLSEVLEIASGGRTGLTLGLTAVFHLLMAPGVWGAWAGQPGRSDALGRVGVAMASLGYLILAYPPVAVALGTEGTVEGYIEYLRSNPLYQAAGFLVTLGLPLFGIALLRARSCPLWTGLVLLVGPPVFAATALSGGPDLVSFIANILTALALITIGSRALRTRPSHLP